MDLILFHPAEYESLYNCSFYNVEDVPLERRQHIVLGWIFIVLFVIFEILYIPCIFAIGKNLSNASFKFMFYIGILDIVVLCVAGLLSGYFAITGAVFCSHPTLIYISGVFGLGLWIAESTASMMLALNRCFEVWSPRIASIIYGDKAAWLWLIPVSLYAFFTVYFGKIITFSGIHMSWFFNPHVGYADDFGTTYHNYVASAHNLVLCVGLTALYLGFCISLLYKRCYYEHSLNTVQHDSRHSARYDKMVSTEKLLKYILLAERQDYAKAIFHV
ncbi:serpentine type 7TM GPCR chemoreceptor srt domain-containing protein [Ditylenchus destructor]|nr:serpentine type 7TM GPCR chemoreceptor srt domain-containing protein [Ditylenchus destructor]